MPPGVHLLAAVRHLRSRSRLPSTVRPYHPAVLLTLTVHGEAFYLRAVLRHLGSVRVRVRVRARVRVRVRVTVRVRARVRGRFRVRVRVR